MTLIDIVLQPAIYWHGSNFGVDNTNLVVSPEVCTTSRCYTRVEVLPDRSQCAVPRYQVEILYRYCDYFELRSLLAEPFTFRHL